MSITITMVITVITTAITKVSACYQLASPTYCYGHIDALENTWITSIHARLDLVVVLCLVLRCVEVSRHHGGRLTSESSLFAYSVIPPLCVKFLIAGAVRSDG